MQNTLFFRIQHLIRQHRTQICLSLLLLILSIFGYCICKEAASGDLLAAEWAATYIFPFVAVLSIALSILQRYLASLSLFIGYHAGVLLAVLLVDRGAEALGKARLVILLILLLFALLGACGEFLPKHLAKRRTSSAVPNDSKRMQS